MKFSSWPGSMRVDNYFKALSCFFQNRREIISYSVCLAVAFFILNLTVAVIPSFAWTESLHDPVQLSEVLPYQGEGMLIADVQTPYGEIGADEDDDYLEEEDTIYDPIEPFNRLMFHFNDKLYFWLLKPAARGYSAIVPEPLRISFKNFFNNVTTPIRVVNNILQFKIKSAGTELCRFGVNTTAGILGFVDYAGKNMGIKMKDEDLGQTLGVWGMGHAFYITWPVLGPSSLRDSVGLIGDSFIDPFSYITPAIESIAIKAGDDFNRLSLKIGDYEEIKKDAIDPYSAIKDIYYQHRNSKVDR